MAYSDSPPFPLPRSLLYSNSLVPKFRLEVIPVTSLTTRVGIANKFVRQLSSCILTGPSLLPELHGRQVGKSVSPERCKSCFLISGNRTIADPSLSIITPRAMVLGGRVMVAILPPRGHLAMFGDIFDCHD